VIQIKITGTDHNAPKISKLINDALAGSRHVVSYFPGGTPKENVVNDLYPNRIYIFDDTKKVEDVKNG